MSTVGGARGTAPARRPGRARGRNRPEATEAVAVRIHDYAETSAVAVFLTHAKGLVHAVAKGARRTQNSFRGPLDRAVLYRVRLSRRAREGLYHLHSSDVVDAWPRLRRHPARFAAAALVLEVAADLLREDEAHAELFRTVVFTLTVLDRAPEARLPLAVAFFLARAVALSGHVPETGRCVACGKPLSERQRPLLSPGRGGTLHASCAQGEPGARSVSNETLALLRDLQHRSSAETLLRTPPRGVVRDLRQLLVDWLVHVLERPFRAAGAAERELARVARGAD